MTEDEEKRRKLKTTVCKHKLDSFYLTFKFPKHLEMKETLLKLIATEIEQLETVSVNDNDYYTDNEKYKSTTDTYIHDWSLAKDFSRPWVQHFKPDLDVLLNDVVNTCGYTRYILYDIWFQQYQTGDTHGWHAHGHTFTAVYYLDLPAIAPKTQIVNPYTQDNILTPEVGEGDVLMFPSYVIHRGPQITEKLNKTIISFNGIVMFGHWNKFK